LIEKIKSKILKNLCRSRSAASSKAHRGRPPQTATTDGHHGRPPQLRGRQPSRTALADDVHRGLADIRIGRPLPQAAHGQVRGRTGLAVRRLGGGRFRLGGGQFRLGGGQPIQGVVRLIPLHFHLSLTTSDVLQLLLALVAPMWWRVGVLFVITYTRFHSLHCGAHYYSLY
jgi:hypothetical protein